MAFYECTFIARQDIPAQDVHKLADKFVELFKGLGAQIVKKSIGVCVVLHILLRKIKKDTM